MSTTGAALLTVLLTSAAPHSRAYEGASAVTSSSWAPPPADAVPPSATPGVEPDAAEDAPEPTEPGGGEPPPETEPPGDAAAEEPSGADEPKPESADEPPDDASVEPVPDATSEQSDAAAEEPDDGELTMDDIFGTAEDHEGVEPGGKAGATAAEGTTTGPTDTARPAAAASKKRAFWDKLDTRFRIVSSAYYDIHKTDKRKFGRNENRLEFTFAYTPNEHLQIVGNVEPVFFGVSQARELDDLATRQMLTPFHIESDAAYVALIDVLPNLDIKIGRQILVWGTADKFNPTNNINPDDLEDRPLFTEPIANQMVVVDYAPLADKLWFQGVYVPIFYPALLPPSASAALSDPRAPVPFARESDNRKLEAAQSVFAVDPTLVPDVSATVDMPPNRFVDGQSAVKVGTSLGGVDMSVSYYNGRHDIPTPVDVQSGFKDEAEGTGEGCCVWSEARLVYPRMQVLGLDFTTQLPFLGNMGLWGEGALFFPTPQDIFIEFPRGYDVTPDDDMDNPVTFLEGPTIRKTPFIKATAGLDYTFGKHVYVQAQYLRGFIDEFGVDHIGNYIVGGTDLIFFGRHLILRLFGVVDVPTGRGDDGSYVIFPELIVVPPWGSVTFEAGSFFLLGPKDTKFGQAATGTSIVFFKMAAAF